jgi:hypothetical protein
MMQRFKHSRDIFGASGMVPDPDGPYVLYGDAMLYGSEQFGLGRLDGQADARAVPMPEPPAFTVESVHEAMRKAAPGARELGEQIRKSQLNTNYETRLD